LGGVFPHNDGGTPVTEYSPITPATAYEQGAASSLLFGGAGSVGESPLAGRGRASSAQKPSQPTPDTPLPSCPSMCDQRPLLTPASERPPRPPGSSPVAASRPTGSGSPISRLRLDSFGRQTGSMDRTSPAAGPGASPNAPGQLPRTASFRSEEPSSPGLRPTRLDSFGAPAPRGCSGQGGEAEVAPPPPAREGRSVHFAI
jgi:hypothetical protein